MLMHTSGVLIMTPDSAMVLTGKQSLDYSGGVSAEDNFGIGGYDRIMGAERRGPVLGARPVQRRSTCCSRTMSNAYVVAGERFPRPSPTTDPDDRDISSSPHDGPEFAALGEIFDPGDQPPSARSL